MRVEALGLWRWALIRLALAEDPQQENAIALASG